MRDLARPITEHGPIVVIGAGEVGLKLRELLTDAGEELFVLGDADGEGVELVGDPPRSIDGA